VLFRFASVFAFLLTAVAFVGVTLAVGRFFRPHLPDPSKSTTYECGERPIGPAWINFNPRFFLIALVFLIFEVEVLFLYPVATVYRKWLENDRGTLALAEILVFLLILVVGLAYAWAKRDLDWIKPHGPKEI
jgi:NADH-quinone oxidoreductase subunit A